MEMFIIENNVDNINIYCHYLNAFYFTDYITSITNKFKDYKIQYKYIEYNDIDYENKEFIDKNENVLNIFVQNYDGPGNNIIINTEQLTKNPTLNINNGSNIILDYSISNILFYKNTFDNSELKHFLLPYQVNHKEIFNYDKIYNICMIGVESERRNNIFNTIKSKNFDINMVHGWLSERDNILFRYKILINVHYAENYNIHEHLRVDRCIYNKIIVISENSLYDDNLLLKNHMIICKYEDIINKVIEVFNNYEYYYEKLFKNFDIDHHDNLNTEKLFNTINKLK